MGGATRAADRQGNGGGSQSRACGRGASGSSAARRVTDVVYDAAVLIAADRNDRRVWAGHKARLESGVAAWVPAPVVAQVSRSARQVQLQRFLRGCIIVPLDEACAHAAGRLLGAARASDVVDASVVAL